MTTAPIHLIPQQKANTHPSWCHNPADGFRCECADEDYAVIHSRGAEYLPAFDGDGKPIEIGVDLTLVTKHDGKPAQQLVEVVLPGGYADLDRPQLRRLIAELTYIDALWES